MNEFRPNLLVIGAARSATTALAAGLVQRGVAFTRPKEPHFWAFHSHPTSFCGPGDDEMINTSMVTDLDAYLALYPTDAGSAEWRGDGSVSTLYYAHRSIDTIERMADGSVKLICVLREPAERALSAYRYLRSRGHETEEDFFEAVRLEDERRDAGYHHMWHYQSMSRYAEQLPAFREAFGERLLIAVLEEIQDDPVRFGAQLNAFLDIAPDGAFELPRNVNQSGEPRSRLVAATYNWVRRHPRAFDVARALPQPVRERLRRLNLSGPPTIDLQGFRRRFDRDVAVVEGILGRRVEAWR